MEESIEIKHQKVFDMLMMYRKENNEFYFTLRQTNRNGRLDKGYWFLGDENYLVISFWKGKDWMNKTPRICFIIYKDGKTRFEMWSKDTSSKGQFFHDSLLKELNVRSMDYDDIGYYKDYPSFGPKDYLNSLQEFINHDKKLIDNAIRNNRCFYPGEYLEYAEGVDFIVRENFITQLANIHNYKVKLADRINNSGFLNSIHIQNFGHINDLSITDIPKNNRWIFLTGENGSGKTTILRAIATALCRNNDKETKIGEKYGSFKIDLKVNWEGSIDSFEIKNEDNIKEKKIIPNGFAAYGPIRLLTEGSIDGPFIHIDTNAISKKMTYGLFNPIGILRDLTGPYPLFERAKYMQMAIDNLSDNLSNIIPNVEMVTYIGQVPNGKLLFYEKIDENTFSNKGIEFESLPSGTKSFTALILDLLIRFKEQQPEKSDPGAYNGIVLIDEIDLHLHPKLQKEIITQLAETFPKVQFIVSTHSPVPLLGAPKDAVILKVKRNFDNGIDVQRLDDKIMFEKMMPNALLSSPIFGFDDLIPIAKDENAIPIVEDDYNEIKLYEKLEKDVLSFLTNEKQKELIELFKKKE